MLTGARSGCHMIPHCGKDLCETASTVSSSATAAMARHAGMPTPCTPYPWKLFTTLPSSMARSVRPVPMIRCVDDTCPLTRVIVPPWNETRCCIPRHTPRTGRFRTVHSSSRPRSKRSRSGAVQSAFSTNARSLPPVRMIPSRRYSSSAIAGSARRFGRDTGRRSALARVGNHDWSRQSRRSLRPATTSTR